MSRTVSFTVPGQPVAKGRPRVTTSGGKVRTYTPEKTVRYENLVATYAQHAMRGMLPIGGPVKVFIEAYLEIPKSKRKTTDEADPHYTKPDLDNIIKAALDGINGIVFPDDCAVCQITAAKAYSVKPYLLISVTAIGQE